MWDDDIGITEEFLEIDGHGISFSLAGEGIKVSIHFLRTLSVPTVYDSWEIMVTSQAIDSSVVRETFFPTSNPAFQRQTSPQGSKR